jgi:hypothetical protein
MIKQNRLDLVREVLDKQMLDRLRDKAGRADGLVLELRDGAPPRLAHIESGGVTLARRLHPKLGAWVERRVSSGPRDPRHPYRIAWSLVRDVGLDLLVDIETENTPGGRVDEWLRHHVVRHIPFKKGLPERTP